MPNKFTKGILERQEREYKQQQTPNAPAAEPASIPQKQAPEPKPKKAGKEPSSAFIPETLSKDLDTYIVRDGGRRAKNKTFYLDGTVIQAVKRTAASQRITESKLVNDILKKVLIP